MRTLVLLLLSFLSGVAGIYLGLAADEYIERQRALENTVFQLQMNAQKQMQFNIEVAKRYNELLRRLDPNHSA